MVFPSSSTEIDVQGAPPRGISTATHGLSRKAGAPGGPGKPPRATMIVSTYLIVSFGWRFVIEPPSNDVASSFSFLFKSIKRETKTALRGLFPRLKGSPGG